MTGPESSPLAVSCHTLGAMSIDIQITQQPEADALLARSPLAAMIGMLLDQQVPMEWAFAGPYTIAQRLGESHFNAGDIADYDPDAFAALMSQKPAVHRYPGSMAKRVQLLCRHLVDHYDGDAAAVWESADTGKKLLSNLNSLPGFGKQKSQVFTAFLGKQLNVTPKDWRAAAGDYGEQGAYRSVADVTGPDSLQRVRDFKQQAKRAAKQSASTS